MVCTVVKDPASCRVEKSVCDCEHINWKEVHSVPVLRGEVGGMHLGKVHSKFPWTRGKGEDDVMMFTNRSTHAPGVKLTTPTSTRRTSNAVDAVSDWQQDAEERMGPAGLGEDGNKEDFSGTWKAGLEKKYTHNGLEAKVHAGWKCILHVSTQGLNPRIGIVCYTTQSVVIVYNDESKVKGGEEEWKVVRKKGRLEEGKT